MIYNYDDLSYRILSVGDYFHKEGYFEVSARPYAALSLRVNGTGHFEIDSKHIMTKPGDVLYMPANTPYKVQYSVSESIVIHFENCNYFEVENICLHNPSQINNRFQYLLETWNEQHSINHAKSIVYDILYKIASEQKLSINDTVIANCIHYIDANFCDPKLNIEAICAASFISVSSLQRAFTKYYNISPKQYLIQLRMNRALELLMKGELSIGEISTACGFTDEKYFSRAFKKKYGYPPSQLTKNMNV